MEELFKTKLGDFMDELNDEDTQIVFELIDKVLEKKVIVPIIDPSFNTVDYSKEDLDCLAVQTYVSVHAIQNNEIRWLSYHVANVLKWTYKDKTNAVGVGGCGMDMGFHLVYTLSSILYKDGYALTHRYI